MNLKYRILKFQKIYKIKEGKKNNWTSLNTFVLVAKYCLKKKLFKTKNAIQIFNCKRQIYLNGLKTLCRK